MMHDSTVTAGGADPRGLSRRGFLKASAGGVVAVGAASALSACSGGGSGGGDTTLSMAKTGYYGFYGAMPSKAEQKGNPANTAYADVLHTWLKKNPGVKLKAVNVDVFDQKAITTAVAGRTAPAMYTASALGNWAMPAVYTAFRQGLAADVTDLTSSNDVIAKMASYAKPAFEDSWNVGGKYYGSPEDVGPGDGMFFRRDLFKAAGLAEPKPDWTWHDVRGLSKSLTTGERRGFAFPQWQLAFNLSTSAIDVFTVIPAPKDSWHWKYDYTSMIGRWMPIVEDIRVMLFTDKSALSDVSYNTWTPVQNAFLQDKVAMRPGNLSAYLADPNSADSPVPLAKRVGKPLDEVVGFISYPVAPDGYVPAGGGQPVAGCTSFSPDLSKGDLKKAFDLHLYLIGDGKALMAKQVYASTKDLRLVWTPENLRPVLADTAAKMPGTPEKAWGTHFMSAVDTSFKRPLTPAISSYLPPDKTTGPNMDDAPTTDAMNKMTYETGVDIQATFQHLGEVQNKQRASFSSSVSGADFAAGAKKYYAALDAFSQEHYPKFRSETFQPWYEHTVKPILGG